MNKSEDTSLPALLGNTIVLSRSTGKLIIDMCMYSAKLDCINHNTH